MILRHSCSFPITFMARQTCTLLQLSDNFAGFCKAERSFRIVHKYTFVIFFIFLTTSMISDRNELELVFYSRPKVRVLTLLLHVSTWIAKVSFHLVLIHCARINCQFQVWSPQPSGHLLFIKSIQMDNGGSCGQVTSQPVLCYCSRKLDFIKNLQELSCREKKMIRIFFLMVMKEFIIEISHFLCKCHLWDIYCFLTYYCITEMLYGCRMANFKICSLETNSPRKHWI